MSDINTNTELREADDKPKRLLPGRRLRVAREGLGLSVEEVAGHLRLDPQLIFSLEEDKYENLPGAAYVCGYLRSYARILKLPENEVVQAFTQGQAVEAAIIPENVNILPPKRRNPALIRIVAILVVMGFVAAGFLWIAEQLHLFDSRNVSSAIQQPPNTNPLSPAESPEVNGKLPETPANTDPGRDVFTPPADTSQNKAVPDKAQSKSTEAINKPMAKLNLKYTADSWTEVKDSSGERLIFRLVEKGSVINLKGEPPLWVLLGYANGVEVFIDGKRYDHLQHVQDDVAIFTLGRS